jgi:undecaprenyl-diphosphatase
MLESLLAWDEQTFRMLNEDWMSPILDRLMPVVTNGSNYNLPLLLAAIILILVGRLRGLRFVVLAVISVVIADAIGTYVFKYTLLRPRPCIALEGVRLLVGCTNLPSFPSNHAVNSSVLATLALLQIPRLWLPAAAVVLLIGFSRVYVGVHYPLDILGGSVLGIVVALVLSAIMTHVWPESLGPDEGRRIFSVSLGDHSKVR